MTVSFSTQTTATPLSPTLYTRCVFWARSHCKPWGYSQTRSLCLGVCIPLHSGRGEGTQDGSSARSIRGVALSVGAQGCALGGLREPNQVTGSRRAPVDRWGRLGLPYCTREEANTKRVCVCCLRSPRLGTACLSHWVSGINSSGLLMLAFVKVKI